MRGRNIARSVTRAVGKGWGAGAGEWFDTIERRLLLSGAFDTVGLTALRADAAFSGVDGSGVGIAILDTGVFSTHADLAPNFVAWYDAVRRTSVGSPFDPEGHGTHVAGTAAARNPEIGVATQARLIGVRVLPAEGEARPRHDTVAEGLQWVIDHQAEFNIRVVNMSLGTRQNFNSVPNDPSGEAALIRRLEQLGVTVVTASGNSYADFITPGAATPAVFSTLSVASTWEDDGVGDSFPLFAGGGGPFAAFEREGRRDRLAASSQRSTLPNQVAAPGQTILSTWNNENGRLYNTISGTSMASPLVAGMIALMQDAARTFGGRFLNTSEVVSIVRDTADTIIDSNVTTNGRIEIDSRSVFDLPETGQSFKRVNVYSAVRRVRSLLTGMDGGGPVSGDVNDTIAEAINLGKTDGVTNLGAEGRIGSDGTVSAGNTDVDLFRFELASRGTVTITLSNTAGGTAFDSFLRLFNSAGGQIAFNDDAPGGGVYSRITTGILEPGVYYAGVSSLGNNTYNASTGAGKAAGAGQGDFQIVVALSNPDPNGVATGAVAVDKLPAFFPGNIGSDRGVPVGSQDVDFFLITAPDDGTLRIDVDTSGFGTDGVDAILRVFDLNFNQVAFNDDRTPGDVDPLLSLSMTRGQKFYVSVADFANQAFDPRDPFSRSSAGPGGDYDLSVSFDNGDTNGTVFDAGLLIPTSTIEGVIGGDPGRATVGADGTRDVDFFSVTPGSNGVIDLRVVSPDSSLVSSLSLWLYNPATDNVEEIAQAFGSSPVVRAFVASGETYFVSVTGQGNADFDWFAPATGTGGDTGNYRLESVLRPPSFANTIIDDSVNEGMISAVNVGAQVSASIGEDGGFVIGSTDVDIYRFVPTVTQSIIIRTFVNQEDSADTVLRFFNASGQQLAINDDISNADRGSRIQITVQAGQTYYIGINGYSPDAAAYDVLTGAGAAEGDVGTYVLVINPAAAPEVAILGLNSTPIGSGDTTPALNDGTRFGSVGITNERITRTFTIQNTGNRVLNLTGTPRVMISGPQGVEFVVVTQPAATVAAGGSITFQIRFDPVNVGTRRAMVTIVSDDADEGSYTFSISGQAVRRPDIDVRGSGGAASAVSIVNGDMTPRARDGTALGAKKVGQSVTRTFRIFNLGNSALNLTSVPRVRLSGAHIGDFTITRQPPRTLAAGASTTVVIRFTPTALGRRTVLVTIASNDADEGSYVFKIQGSGTA